MVEPRVAVGAEDAAHAAGIPTRSELVVVLQYSNGAEPQDVTADERTI